MPKHFSYVIIIALIALLPLDNYSQISSGGVPPSFKKSKIADEVPVISFEKPDFTIIELEDKEDAKEGLPPRVAVHLPLDANPLNNGDWVQLDDQTYIWRTDIEAKEALAIGLHFVNFELKDADELFVYDSKKEFLLGAFTKENNSNDGKFATQHIIGEKIRVEFHTKNKPANGENVPFVIEDIAYFYRGVANFADKWGESQECHININCSEGDRWQTHKKGVVHINFQTSGGTYICSGSLINNTAEDKTPYVIFAEHCGGNDGINHNQWVFYFNYERSGCENQGTTTPNSTTGCDPKATGSINGGSDFFLVELDNDVPESYNPYWNGWDIRPEAPSIGVSIHHPAGDSKKVSTFETPLLTTTWNGYIGAQDAAWSVRWASTVNGHGVTEGGSSGSPIFNQFGRIVGTLTGGSSSCEIPTNRDMYGKISYHWESNGSADADKLKPWLDPTNTGLQYIEGRDYNNPSNTNVYFDNTYIQTGSSYITSTEFGGNSEGETLAIMADEFDVPTGETWSINRIMTKGQLSPASAPHPDNFGVIIFSDNSGTPGDIIYENKTIQTDNPLNPMLNLINGIDLSEGTYWISIFGIYNTHTNLAQGSWRWYVGDKTVGYQAHHLDQTSLMGGHPWTSLQDIGYTSNRSAYFALQSGSVMVTSEVSLDFGNVSVGNTSDIQSYTFEGDDLAGQISVTAPSEFEISTSSSGGFTTSLTLTPNTGSINQTIYVRFKPNYGGIIDQRIRHLDESGNSLPIYTNVSGVSIEPEITISEESIAFGEVEIGLYSILTFQLSGSNLESDITITSPSKYEVSTDEADGYTSNLTVAPTEGMVEETIFVKYTPTSTGSNVGYIQNTATGAASQSILVTGQGVEGTTSVDELKEQSIVLYPNPADDKINISFGTIQDSFSVSVHDLVGRSVISQEFFSDTDASIDLSELNPGIFIIRITNNIGTESFKIIVE